MPNYVKLVGTEGTEVILEKDENGNVTKSAKVGEPVSLTADERKTLEEKGFVFEDSSKAEAEVQEKAESNNEQPVGSDVVSAAPTFSTSATSNNQGTGSVKWRSRSEK